MGVASTKVGVALNLSRGLCAHSLYLNPLHTKLDPPLSFVPRYQPANEEVLLKAFEVLDQDNKSYLSSEDLKKILMEEGEPFSQEEMDEMLQAAVDPDKGAVLYKNFVTLMLPEAEQT